MMPYLRWRSHAALRSILPDRFGRAEQRELAAREIGVVGDENAGFVNLYYYFTAAAEQYRMRPLEVDTVLVKADWVWPVHPHDYHWSRYIRGRLDITESPGDHWAMYTLKAGSSSWSTSSPAITKSRASSLMTRANSMLRDAVGPGGLL